MDVQELIQMDKSDVNRMVMEDVESKQEAIMLLDRANQLRDTLCDEIENWEAYRSI